MSRGKRGVGGGDGGAVVPSVPLTSLGTDSLRVKEKGHELDPQVGIGNVRSGSVLHAGRYFVAMREATARDLIAQLLALTE